MSYAFFSMRATRTRRFDDRQKRKRFKRTLGTHTVLMGTRNKINKTRAGDVYVGGVV